MSKSVVLVTGSGGQIGTVLVSALRKIHGVENVLSTDLKPIESEGPFETLDVTDSEKLAALIDRYKVTEIYHLAALLSSSGEKNPALTWKINFTAHLNLLQIAQEKGISKIFFPSTIGIYGPSTPRLGTPQHSSFEPATVYGISKLTAEMWNEYYRNRYDMDIRSLRYPGVISYEVIPEGGTTDFAVEIFFALKRKGHYTCYLKPDTVLPMIYMPDVLKATLDLMAAPKASISTSMGYNLAGFSLSPEVLFAELLKSFPKGTISYEPDHRQKIADTWSQTIDDSIARRDWKWQPDYNMQRMAEDMVKHVV